MVLGGAAVEEILAWYRVSLAARGLGVAAAAIEYAAAYAEDRVQFGQPIGRFQSLARMRDANQTAIAAARAYVLQAGWEIDRGAASAADTASRARDLAADVVTRATIEAVQIHGGYGFVNDFPVEKLMRDARAFEVLGGNEALSRVPPGTLLASISAVCLRPYISAFFIRSHGIDSSWSCLIAIGRTSALAKALSICLTPWNIGLS